MMAVDLFQRSLHEIVEDSLSPKPMETETQEDSPDDEIEICDVPEDLTTRKRIELSDTCTKSDLSVPKSHQEQPLRQNNENRRTYFSIENILRPEFGAKENKIRHVVKTRDTSAQQSGLWPAWVYCTRYSDRPSSGPRIRKIKKREKRPEEKRPRTAFTAEQLAKLKTEFEENRYLSEQRRQQLARDLNLNECQIKIWFQNKRAKMKKSNGQRNGLALHLMAQGLYNHATVNVLDEAEDESATSS